MIGLKIVGVLKGLSNNDVSLPLSSLNISTNF